MRTAHVDEYRPVDCSLHDRYEAAAVRRQVVTLEVTEDGLDETISGIIADIRVTDGAEYLVMADGRDIRLDRIRSFAVEKP